jgi:hypothetical protein
MLFSAGTGFTGARKPENVYGEIVIGWSAEVNASPPALSFTARATRYTSAVV